MLDDADSWTETYEPDDGREGGWQHRHFARTLGRIYGRRAMTLAMPRPVLRLASGLDRLFRRGNAKLTRDRVGYFCHPDWVAAAREAPARTPLAPRGEDPDRPQGDRRLVPRAGLAEIIVGRSIAGR